ncbi:MAG: xanthine dehydrogenase family protein subunit M [bacterium]
MAILTEFEYHKPTTVSAAIQLLAKYKHAQILAGGTDLINNLKTEVIQPDAIIDIKGIKALQGITFKNNVLTIGALVTFSEIIDSKLIQSKFPVIIDVAKSVASTGIRNRATMVGNICSAVACGDSCPLVAAYNAQIIVQGKTKKYKIPAADWFLGNKLTVLKKNELVLAIEFPLPAKKYAGCFVKLRRYEGEDLAQASVLVLALPENQYRISFGSVNPIPIRAKEIESLLNGHNPTPALIDRIKQLIPSIISPITDIRATKEYREHMVPIMFERGLNAAISRLQGNGPEYGHNLI